ncbi:MAG: hypothetical protein JWR61_453 [Ferruginibacter sp.]|nr:hypothetical protein [Ferruginibacter sp.]
MGWQCQPIFINVSIDTMLLYVMICGKKNEASKHLL